MYTLAAVYLMLFNPRTENSTYCVLGPAVGLFYAEQLRTRRWLTAGLLLAVMAACVGSYELGKHLTPPGAKTVWLAPLACCCLAAYLAPVLTSELASELGGDGANQQGGASPLATPTGRSARPA